MNLYIKDSIIYNNETKCYEYNIQIRHINGVITRKGVTEHKQ